MLIVLLIPVKMHKPTCVNVDSWKQLIRCLLCLKYTTIWTTSVEKTMTSTVVVEIQTVNKFSVGLDKTMLREATSINRVKRIKNNQFYLVSYTNDDASKVRVSL